MQCIGFPLKIHFFNFYIVIYEKIDKQNTKKILKTMKIWIENLFFQYLFIFYRKNSKKFKKIQKKKQIWKKIRKSGLSTKIRCSASDFR